MVEMGMEVVMVVITMEVMEMMIIVLEALEI